MKFEPLINCRSQSRGVTELSWLTSYHTFSFSRYQNPHMMGFRKLRVLNQDYVQPGKGFSTHSHQNMEIITFVIKGKVEHQDSMGNQIIIHEKEIQCMSAGSGVTHSEFNPVSDEELEFLQIWIEPELHNTQPSYQQMSYARKTINSLSLLVCNERDKFRDALTVKQDIKLFYGQLSQNETLVLPTMPSRFAWIQMIKGQLEIEKFSFGAGDGVGFESSGQELKIHAQEHNIEFLFFDLN